MKSFALSLAILLIAIQSPMIQAEWNETPDYWKCYNRVSGSWTFGIAPYGCNASAFGSDQHLTNNYIPVIFEQSQNYSSERNRYMQETYSMIKEAATYYIQSRKPNVSESELSAFQHAALAVAHQESFWSHYRKASQDGRYKMMRGDFGHGHGLMQVDDRAHYTATTQGKGWELITNILYSLDEYYTAWRSADSKWCIKQYGGSWRNRSREAYSQYNGGPSASCRWTNPNHRWARNDRGFEQKYDGRGWENYVANRSAPSKINVNCLANGGTNCPPGGGTDTSGWYNKLLQTPTNEACVFDGESLHCMSDMRHSACLTSLGNYDTSTTTRLSNSEITGINKITYDPHKTCLDNVAHLAPVGSFIKLKTAINLRATPNGELIHTIPKDSVLQVTDFAVFDSEKLNRFYRVNHNNAEGYIWGGNKDEFSNWYELSFQKITDYPLPVNGDWVLINVDKLNLRATPGGAIIDVLDKNTAVIVKGLITQGSTNKSFLHIETDQNEGYIYAGYTIPNSTTSYWVNNTAAPNSNQAAYCPEGSYYNSQFMVCQNQQDTYGPFSRTMIDRCQQWGGGSACSAEFDVTLDGRDTTLSRWSTAWFMKIRENKQCPFGTFRQAEYGWHCVETNTQNEISDVYGPFGTTLVNRCLAKGGGTACYFNRWSASGYLYWSQP
ncbi:SH3 domain-containing protein [Aliikangiella marina]|uniref:SH3 domain-containing protein n=1 Tax=Aliikangiella marina TaxID=1712262 RepID=A0A545THR6_9GAMM|nr:SH3 domain-containing protein [Aliikangiella marina]TQV76701.1 SH3 domain-containing protein [Aliikangiella marina]